MNMLSPESDCPLPDTSLEAGSDLVDGGLTRATTVDVDVDVADVGVVATA